MGSFLGVMGLILSASLVLCKGWEMPYGGQNMDAFKKTDISDPAQTAQIVGKQLPSAFFEEQITGGRHPNDDKRYTIEQLNQAARHRNVYYDTVGGDPYGNSSPVLTRSHVGRPHTKRSVQEGTEAMAAFGPVSKFYPAAQQHQQPAEKRYNIAALNYAARHRNVYFDTVGGDPYGSSSPVLTRQHILVHHNKRAAQNDEETSYETQQSLKKKLRFD